MLCCQVRACWSSQHACLMTLQGETGREISVAAIWAVVRVNTVTREHWVLQGMFTRAIAPCLSFRVRGKWTTSDIQLAWVHPLHSSYQDISCAVTSHSALQCWILRNILFFLKHFIGFSICNHKMRRSLLKKRPQESHQQNKTTMEHQNTRALAWNCCFSLISKCCTKWDSGTDEFSPSSGTKRAPTPWVQPADRSNLLAEEQIKSLVPELHVPAKTFQRLRVNALCLLNGPQHFSHTHFSSDGTQPAQTTYRRGWQDGTGLIWQMPYSNSEK